MSQDASHSGDPMSTHSGLGRQLVSFVFAVLLVIPLGIFYREFFAKQQEANAIEIHRAVYRGWTNALYIVSPVAEAVIVPEIGRVMQFRFRGEESPFWENTSLYGKSPDPKSSDWGNFGGDKSWPSPQDNWGRWTGRSWPPPPAFDSMPVEGVVKEGRVLLRSEVDPFFRIRTERVIRLDPTEPKMIIVTRYEKMDGNPQMGAEVATNRVGIWIITQLKDPLAVYVPVPQGSLFSEGYTRQSEALPLDLTRSGNLLSLRRNPGASHKIGTDASSLLWVGERVSLRIDAPRFSGVDYPDQGSSAEIYTNPDPLKYVELEMLGPLHHLKAGMSVYQTNVYTLAHRTEADPDAEARRIFKP